tara:strand:+ start:6121 stop:7317 length:1197 start_codon:yes stop_codon:yes gene_type:complete
MPLNNPSPNFALLSSFNARTWSGVNVFNRGSNNVSLPTFAIGEGIYEDAISFLNGRGSHTGLSIPDILNTQGSSISTAWTVTIDANDKVKITADSPFKIRLLSGTDILGVGSTTFGLDDYSFICPNNWIRGNELESAQYQISDASGYVFFTFIITNSLNVQDLIVAIRERGTTSDLDDVNTANCIEHLDITANTSSSIRWYLNSSGHVECMYDSAISNITWVSTTFRDRLGFTGSETPSGSSIKTLTATHPLPGSLFPSRPYQRHHLQTDTLTQARRKIGGGYTSNFIGSYIQSILDFDLDALLDEKDLYRHFTNNFVEYIPSGERINFYQGWGDSRRALITSGVNDTQPAYDLLYTSEDNGDQGRIRASVVNNGMISLAYPNRLRRRVPVSMTLEHL